MKTFKCNFGKGITCEMHTTDTPPEKGTKHILGMEWEGKPKKRHMRQYIAWVNTVNKTLTDEWGIKIMHVFQTAPNSIEAWQYEPNKAPQRVSLR